MTPFPFFVRLRLGRNDSCMLTHVDCVPNISQIPYRQGFGSGSWISGGNCIANKKRGRKRQWDRRIDNKFWTLSSFYSSTSITVKKELRIKSIHTTVKKRVTLNPHTNTPSNFQNLHKASIRSRVIVNSVLNQPLANRFGCWSNVLIGIWQLRH